MSQRIPLHLQLPKSLLDSPEQHSDSPNSASSFDGPNRFRRPTRSISDRPIDRFPRTSSISHRSSVGSYSSINADSELDLALLSHISFAFLSSIQLKHLIKNDDSSGGAEAVECLCAIGIPIRSLALIIGNALERQFLFHNVNSYNRLRDSKTTYYTLGPRSSVMGELTPQHLRARGKRNLIWDGYGEPPMPTGKIIQEQLERSYVNIPNTPGKRSFWAGIVPESVLSKLSSTEHDRQQYIYEFINMQKHLSEDIVFMQNVFESLFDSTFMNDVLASLYTDAASLRAVNEKFLDMLSQRQENDYPVVGFVGDICQANMPEFQSFVSYASNLGAALKAVKTGKIENSQLAEYIIKWEQWSDLEYNVHRDLESTMQAPVYHLSRLSILLQRIYKRTPSSNPDCFLLLPVLSSIGEIQSNVSAAVGTILADNIIDAYESAPPTLREAMRKEEIIPSNVPEANTTEKIDNKDTSTSVGKFGFGNNWVESVPKEVLESLTNKQQKRQGKIFEFIETQENFVKNIEFLQTIKTHFLEQPSNVIGFTTSQEKDQFASEVLLPTEGLLAMNKTFLKELRERQSEDMVVSGIGDLLFRNFCEFQPFFDYITRLTKAQSKFLERKEEKKEFAKYMSDFTKLPEAQRRGVDFFIGCPFHRIAGITLLLTDLMKLTHAEEYPEDARLLQDSFAVWNEFNRKLNAETNRLNDEYEIQVLRESLDWGANFVELNLEAISRKIIKRTSVKWKGFEDLDIYLLDNAILMTRPKFNKKCKVPFKPILFHFLLLDSENELLDEIANQGKGGRKAKGVRAASMIGENEEMVANLLAMLNSDKQTITIGLVGKIDQYYPLVFASDTDCATFRSAIIAARSAICDSTNIFELKTVAIPGKRFSCGCKANSRIVLASDDGIYIIDDVLDESVSASERAVRKVMSIDNVTQIDTLVDSGIAYFIALQ
ncbi:RHO1 GDP-GTP exchange protein 2, partial [Nowakowskiella sp. JEL0078]